MKKQSKETKKLLLNFIDEVINGKIQFRSADTELDNLRHPKIYGEKDLFHHEDYDLGAIAMLNLISKGEGWEESEKHYYNKFFGKNN